MHLTKSLFVDYMNYPKLAWWKVNNPNIYNKIRKTETEEEKQYIISIGQAVEDQVKILLTQQHDTKIVDLMPRFISWNSEVADEDQESDDDEIILTQYLLDLPKALDDTLEAIRNHIPVLYQPSFQYGDCFVRADFMVRNGTSYDLIEAKAKSWIRKDVTDDGEKKPIGSIEDKFIHDISFQKYVINHVLAQHQLGQLWSIYMAYLNKEYIKNWTLSTSSLIKQDPTWWTKEIEVFQRKKFTQVIVDDSLMSNDQIETKLTEIRSYITMDEEQANKHFPWWWLKYLEYFGQEKPFGTVMGMWIHHSNKNHISDLYYTGNTKISDLTPVEVDGFNDGAQQFIAQYLQCKRDWQPIINRSKLKEVFTGFQYPICFYDYESISVPVPILDQTRPYMQTVVQYSLHKYYEDGKMKHYGWIYVSDGAYSRKEITIDNNPNAVEYECEQVITWSYKDLLKQMIADIGDDLHRSTFIVRHEWFENSRNKEIAKLFPDLANAFLTINERTYDLKRVVSDGYYFDPACKWSASIKKVLPVLVPEMSYEGMKIGRWDVAMRALYDLITDKTPEHERSQIIKNLLLYCWQDTLAMVRIFEAVREMI
jgi:Domain of unknown function(DUF2779)